MLKCLAERGIPSAKAEETKRVDVLTIAPGQRERKRFILRDPRLIEDDCPRVVIYLSIFIYIYFANPPSRLA